MSAPVTLWYRIQKPGAPEIYNHLQAGWSEDSAPTPISAEQRRAWSGALWRPVRAYLDADHTVTEEILRPCRPLVG
jgi:hypothetical protein